MMHWAYDSFFYHIYPLGFCNAPLENDFSSSPINRLACISEWIPNMKELGVNGLYLGPVFESTAHGYDTANYYEVDRRLGTKENLKMLVNNMHNAGIRVLFDGVFNHVGRDFWAFKDVLQHRGHSMHCDWIHGLDFNRNNCYNDGLAYSGWEGHFNLVKLNLHNHYVKEHIFKAVEMWIKDFDIDGIRLDVAYCIDVNFLKELRNFCKAIKPDFWLLGEVLHGDYRTWANPHTLDSVTNYDCYKGLHSSFNDNNLHEISSTLNRQFADYGLYKDFATYNFADNHDVNRVASTLRNKANLYPLYALLMTMPGCPSVYYGSEYGVEGIREWNDQPLRPPIEAIKSNDHSHNKDLFNAIRKFWNIRQNSHALKYGKYFPVGVSSHQIAFVRQSDQESLIVVINSSDQPARLELYNLPISAHQAVDILNDDQATYGLNRNRTIIDNIPPNWARILQAR